MTYAERHLVEQVVTAGLVIDRARSVMSALARTRSEAIVELHRTMSYGEIAAALGISRQQVHRLAQAHRSDPTPGV